MAKVTPKIAHELPSPLDELTQRVLGLEARLLDSHERVTARMLRVEERIATVEHRMSALSIPDQLASVGKLLKEQVAIFEWIANGLTRIREVVGDFSEEHATEPDGADGVPNLSTLAATLAGAGAKGAKGTSEGGEEFLAGLLRQFGAK